MSSKHIQLPYNLIAESEQDINYPADSLYANSMNAPTSITLDLYLNHSKIDEKVLEPNYELNLENINIDEVKIKEVKSSNQLNVGTADFNVNTNRQYASYFNENNQIVYVQHNHNIQGYLNGALSYTFTTTYNIENYYSAFITDSNNNVYLFFNNGSNTGILKLTYDLKLINTFYITTHYNTPSALFYYNNFIYLYDDYYYFYKISLNGNIIDYLTTNLNPSYNPIIKQYDNILFQLGSTGNPPITLSYIDLDNFTLYQLNSFSLATGFNSCNFSFDSINNLFYFFQYNTTKFVISVLNINTINDLINFNPNTYIDITSLITGTGLSILDIYDYDLMTRIDLNGNIIIASYDYIISLNYSNNAYKINFIAKAPSSISYIYMLNIGLTNNIYVIFGAYLTKISNYGIVKSINNSLYPNYFNLILSCGC
jgi:hypothetical protein